MKINLPNITLDQERIFNARYKRLGHDSIQDLENWVLNQIRKEQSEMNTFGVETIEQIESIANKKDLDRKAKIKLEEDKTIKE